MPTHSKGNMIYGGFGKEKKERKKGTGCFSQIKKMKGDDAVAVWAIN